MIEHSSDVFDGLKCRANIVGSGPVKFHRVVDVKRTDRDARQFFAAGPAGQGLAEIAGDRTDVGAPAAGDVERQGRPVHLRQQHGVNAW